MFMVIFLAMLFTNYVLVADLEEKYKIGYSVALILIVGLILLTKFL